MKNLLTRIAAISIPLLLAACGDTINEQINANVGAVESSKDLPECTKDIAGQTAFVSETHEFLGCDGKEWQTLSANTVSVGDNVCTSTSLSDGTGFEIFCNGASIGTVKNGEKGDKGDTGEKGDAGMPGAKGDTGEKGADGQKGDKGDTGAKGDKGDDGAPGTNGTNGTNGKDGVPGADGTGCRILESTALTATIACGSETFTMDLTGYVDVPEECDPNDEGCAVQMDDVELSGVSQKGPFVSGTDVTAYELENGRSLKQTGKTFGGKIENQDGSFNIRTVKLKSSFAYLVADGFYRNEVTGRNSAATIKLRALTNLDGRSMANINLVTHLEYDRVQRLVTKDNKSVIEAKRAAEKSLFAAFNIDNSGFKGFAEDLNIFKEGDGNAALLAVSAMLQGDRNESELTALLASFSVDLGDNGVWDDSLQRAKIADWAMKADIEGRLATIRANVEGWKLSDSKAPAFEAPFRNFWMTELGVDECTGDSAGTLFATKNTYSAYYAKNDSAFTAGDSSLVRLICAASGDSYAWRFATDIEKDTAALSAELTEGSATYGKINTNRVYVKEGNWRRGTQLDLDLAKSCVAGIKKHTTYSAVSTDTTWYICVDDNGKLDGYTIPTSWRKATEAEADTAQFGIPKTAADSIKQGHINKGRFFVYEENGWRRGTENDYLLEKACLAKMENKVYRIKNQFYTCTKEEKIQPDGVKVETTWRASTADEADTLGWTAPSAEYPDIVKLGNIDKSRVYVYDNGWRRGTNLDTDPDLGPCLTSKTNKVVKSSNNLWYKCFAQEWREATTYERDTASLEIPTRDTARYNALGTAVYVYDMTARRWRVGSDLDTNSKLGPCTAAMKDTIRGTSATDWYKCSPNYAADANVQPVSWMKLSQAEYDTLGFGKCREEYVSVDYLSRADMVKWFTKEGVLLSSADKEYDLIRVSEETCNAQISNSTIEVRYGTKPDAIDGNMVQGRNAENYYTYDEVQREWMPMTKEQYDLDLGGCTIARTNHTFGTSDEYWTFPKGLVKRKDDTSPYYLCKDDGGEKKWVRASTARYETKGKACDNEHPRMAYTANEEYRTAYNEYKYVCEADTFRAMTPSEKWAATVDEYDPYHARCGKSDEGETRVVSVAYEVQSTFICKNKLYVWDGKEQILLTTQIDVSTRSIGMKIWTDVNLSGYYTSESGPYIINPAVLDPETREKSGLFYSHDNAQAACSELTHSGDAFRLPTPSEYKALIEQYVPRISELTSSEGWPKYSGSDTYGMGFYPNGYVETLQAKREEFDDPDWDTDWKIGYMDGPLYMDNLNFTDIGYVMWINVAASLLTSKPDSTAIISPFNTYWFMNGKNLVFKQIPYAGVRCVLGDKPDPPISNDE